MWYRIEDHIFVQEEYMIQTHTIQVRERERERPSNVSAMDNRVQIRVYKIRPMQHITQKVDIPNAGICELLTFYIYCVQAYRYAHILSCTYFSPLSSAKSLTTLPDLNFVSITVLRPVY